MFIHADSYSPFSDVRSTIRRTSAPESWPITLSEAKRALDLDGVELSEDEDEEIHDEIATAIEQVESDVMRSFRTQEWTLYMDRFPCVIELRRPPIISVDSIVYVDTNGDEQTLDSADYDVDLTTAPGRIAPAFNTTWPQTRHVDNAVTVIFTAGYQTEIPRLARKAILLALKANYHGCQDDAYQRFMHRVRWTM